EMRYHTGKKSKKREKAAEGALEALEKRRKIIGAYPLSRAGAAELDGTIFTLRALGYIGQDDQLTLKGRLLKSMFHHAGIFIVELITQGLLDELTPGELAEVCSWFTFDSERRLNNRHVLGRSLTRVRGDLWRTMQHIYGVEERAGLSFSPNIFADFHGVALSWARGMSLNGLLRRIDLAEGDLLMLLNQTIDLLQQVQAAVGHLLDARGVWEQFSPLMTDGQLDNEASDKRGRVRLEQMRLQRERLERLRPLLAQASAALLHGIIIQSRTIPSMAARMQEPAVPLDAEEDIEPSDIEPL
ncbi:MAG: hypothetical protein WCD86_15310, partial [Ktedonobacteraceae bacterium]